MVENGLTSFFSELFRFLVDILNKEINLQKQD